MKIYKLILIVLAAVLISACHKDKVEDEPAPFATKANHTLLIYLEGDNSLSRFADSNIQSCIKGICNSDNPINLVIYKDNNSGKNNGLPEMFLLKPSARITGSVDTVYIKKWNEEVNSADPNNIASIINLAFSKFDTEIHGVEFWSHGMSWIPSPDYKAGTLLAPETRSMHYIGQDNTEYTELWQLRQALEMVDYPIDYLMFDACHMATAEVLYELRNHCKYILASCTEIMGEGFPYNEMVKSLSTAHDHDKLLTALRMAYNNYRDLYINNGTFSLLCTDGAEKLLDVCQKLAKLTDEETICANPENFDAQIQHYGRNRVYSRYYFYDILDWADALAIKDDALSSESELAAIHEQLRQALSECVDLCYFSRIFTEGVEPLYIDKSCGLALSVPQLWTLTEKYMLIGGMAPSMYTSTLDAAYRNLGWQIKDLK